MLQVEVSIYAGLNTILRCFSFQGTVTVALSCTYASASESSLLPLSWQGQWMFVPGFEFLNSASRIDRSLSLIDLRPDEVMRLNSKYTSLGREFPNI